jgi:hypothetical protein
VCALFGDSIYMKNEKKARIILIKINVGINQKRGLTSER